MTFKKGQSGNPKGKPKGTKSEKIKLWEQLKVYICDDGAEKFKAELMKLDGKDFIDKYGFEVPLGVKGRNSDNKLFKEKMGWEPTYPLYDGMKKTYEWINKQVNN